MKKLISLFFVVVLGLVSISSIASPHNPHHAKARQGKGAEKVVTLHFFWSKDCPHCVAAHPFVDKLKAQYPWLRVQAHEISGNPSNTQLFEKMARQHGRETSFVPTFFVCDKMIVGYTSADTTGAEIRNAINECHNKN